MSAAVPGTPVTSANPNTTTNTSLAVTLGSTTVGDLNVITLSGLASGTGINPTVTTPTGWTKVFEQMSNSGTPSTFVATYWRFYQSGDGSSVTFNWAHAGQMVASCEPFSNADTTAPVPYSNSIPHASGAGATYAITGTTGTDPGLLVYGGANKTGTAWSNLSDNDAGQRTESSSATMCQRITAAELAGGTAYSKTMTGSASTIGVQWAFIVKGSASGTTFAGAGDMTSASTLSGAASAALVSAGGMTSGSVMTGQPAASLTAAGGMASGSALAGQPGITGSAALTSTSTLAGSVSASLVAAGGMASGSALTGQPAAVRSAAGGMTSGSTFTGAAQTPIVTQLLTGGVQWVAHRDATYATNGEETLEGYTAAAAQYSKAILEISVWDTSDGVYVCSHDQTTGRVFSGTNLTITSTAWATLSPNGASTAGRPTTLVGGNPMRRLEEILDAFPTRLFIVENKHGTNQATLSTLLDAHALGRWMFKGPYNDTANAVTAAGHGAPMWLYFYPSQLGSLSTSYSAVSGTGVPTVFGLGDYSTAPVPVQSDATTFFTFTTANGIKTWAHILGTSTQKTTADGQASTAGASFNGYMTSSFPAIAPNDSNSAAMTSGSTLAGALTASLAAAGGMTSASVLTGTVAAVKPTTGGMTSGSALTGAATASVAAAGGMASSSILTGASALSVPESGALTSGSVLTGAVQKSTAGAAGMSSGSALVGQPVAVMQAAGAMTSGSALTGSPSASLIGTAGMISVSALAGAVSVTDQAATGMASASTLTGSGTTGAAGSMQSASSLAGAATATLGTAAGSMQSASSLAGAATATLGTAAGSMQSASSLAGAATATLGTAAGMVSASSLTGNPSRAAQSAAGMTSGTALTGSAASTGTGAAGMTSLSSFAAVTAAQLAAMASMQSASLLTGSATIASAGPDLIYSVFTGRDRWHVTTGSSRWTVTTGAVG